MNILQVFCLSCFSCFSMFQFFSLKMFLASHWSCENKALIVMTATNFILSTISFHLNQFSSLSCLSAFFNMLYHFMWNSSLTVAISAVILLWSSKGVTSFEIRSLKFSWWCSYLKLNHFWKDKSKCASPSILPITATKLIFRLTK